LNQASFSIFVAAILSLFVCHLLFNKFISSIVVWYQISTLVTQYFLNLAISSGVIQSGLVSIAIQIILNFEVSFNFFASSRVLDFFTLYHSFILKLANLSLDKSVFSI
jgi:hypothetical protein